MFRLTQNGFLISSWERFRRNGMRKFMFDMTNWQLIFIPNGNGSPNRHWQPIFGYYIDELNFSSAKLLKLMICQSKMIGVLVNPKLFIRPTRPELYELPMRVRENTQDVKSQWKHGVSSLMQKWWSGFLPLLFLLAPSSRIKFVKKMRKSMGRNCKHF